MLHILFLILKIIGWILLAILGLVVGILSLILLVPVRYRAQAAYDKSFSGNFKITWLLHMILLLGSYDEQENDMVFCIRILGITISKREPSQPEEESVKTDTAVTKEDIDPLEQMAVDKPVPEPNVPEKPPAKSVSRKETAAKSFPFDHFCDKVKQGKEFIEKDKNKKTFHLLWHIIKAFVKHTFPRKITGNVTFGLEDPYITGQILSGLSLFYGLYRNNLKIIPIFDQNRLEGCIQLKGHIRLGTILILIIRLFADKNFRVLLKRYRNRGDHEHGRE